MWDGPTVVLIAFSSQYQKIVKHAIQILTVHLVEIFRLLVVKNFLQDQTKTSTVITCAFFLSIK